MIVANNFSNLKQKLTEIISNFKFEGTIIGNEKRNIIKYFDVEGLKVNIKSFKQPNPVNSIVYKYFRKSKARRSFENAEVLISKKFNTPQPIAYLENTNFFGLTSSYYISEQLENSITLREVIQNLSFPNREKILKRYTFLMYQLHENGIEFIDNSSANFLIKKNNNEYNFYIVDLNRMNFLKKMSITTRLENFSRIENEHDIIHIISNEYASLVGLKTEYCFKIIMKASNNHFNNRKLKKKLKFYKTFNKKN